MYYVNEFTFTLSDNPEVVAAYTADTLPEGRAVSRHGNAIRIYDSDRPDVAIIVSRPRAEGSVYPLPLHDENLGWAFGAGQA